MENQQEIWKDVKGYEGYYQVSNLGRVKSLSRKFSPNEKILKPCYDDFGYEVYGLCINGKSKNERAHVLVAINFLGHTKQGFKLVVDHIDGNPTNNNVLNLQIIKSRLNTIKGHKNKTSQYTGVCFHKTHKKWIAYIQLNKINIHLGYFKSEIEAFNAYNSKLNEKTS